MRRVLEPCSPARLLRVPVSVSAQAKSDGDAVEPMPNPPAIRPPPHRPHTPLAAPGDVLVREELDGRVGHDAQAVRAVALHHPPDAVCARHVHQPLREHACGVRAGCQGQWLGNAAGEGTHRGRVRVRACACTRPPHPAPHLPCIAVHPVIALHLHQDLEPLQRGNRSAGAACGQGQGAGGALRRAALSACVWRGCSACACLPRSPAATPRNNATRGMPPSTPALAHVARGACMRARAQRQAGVPSPPHSHAACEPPRDEALPYGGPCGASY